MGELGSKDASPCLAATHIGLISGFLSLLQLCVWTSKSLMGDENEKVGWCLSLERFERAGLNYHSLAGTKSRQ